jgi:hypothetical protein
MTVHSYKFIENRKWEDTANEITELETQGWDLVNVVRGGDGVGLKPYQAWLRKPKS